MKLPSFRSASLLSAAVACHEPTPDAARSPLAGGIVPSPDAVAASAIDSVCSDRPKSASGWQVSTDPTLSIGVAIGDPAYEFGRLLTVLQAGDLLLAGGRIGQRPTGT